MKIGRWQASAWYTTGLDVGDRRRFEDIGINVRRRRGNLTIHLGPNKLNRYPGYQAGVEVNGSRAYAFAILKVWVVYWTLTCGLSWRERERGK